MTTTYDQFSVVQEKTLAKLSKLNAIGTSTGNKFVELNIAALNENSNKVTQAADVVVKLKNAKSMEDLQVTMQPTVDVMTNYWKASVDIANDANTELSKLFEETLSESNSVMSETLDELEKNAFPGAQVTASAIKTAMSLVNQTFDTAAKVQRQAQEAVNTTLASGNKTAKSKKKN